jgi:hypothetical protein
MTCGISGKNIVVAIRKKYTYIKIKIYGVLLAQVTTVNVLTAEPTTPAKIEPSTAWFTTISGSILPSQDTAFGTIRYPAEPIVKPSAQKIKIASDLDILYPSGTCSFCAIHCCATCKGLITLIVNFYRVLIIKLSGTGENKARPEKFSIIT